MIQKIDKYGNTSTDDGRVIVLDKYANIKKVNNTTLQTAYNNSTDGQIIPDAIRGPFKIKGSVPNSVLFDLVDLAGVNALSFLSTGDIECRPNMSIYYDAFNSIGFDTIYGVLLKSFDYTKADGRIQYANDYTSLYTSRTLIDKGYADAHYSSSGSGTVTSVAAITLGTSGTDLSSTVSNPTTTPVITLNVPTASATNRGVLSSTDWTTFNNKQNALGYTPVRFIIKDQTQYPTVTGVGETLQGTYFVPANTFSPNDSIKIIPYLAEKTGILGTCTMRVRLGTSSTFGSSLVIATYTTGVSELWCIMQRSGFTLRGGNIRGMQGSLSRQSDVIATSGVISVSSFNTTIDNWFFTSLQLSNLADSVFQSNFTMTN
jgi:hypothetical protein